MSKKVLSYCGELVRQADADRFLLSMFVTTGVREDLWALFAFNCEIAKTRDVVSESTLGLIRLQWWRDSIASIYEGGNVPSHEILKPLSEVIKRYDLPREHFDKLIYAREFDLEDVLPGNVEGLFNYCDFTTAPLLALAVQICGDDPLQEVIQPIAINYALAGVLRSTAHYARQGRCLLPEDLMMKYGVTLDNIFEEDLREGMALLIKDVVNQKMSRVKPDNIVLKGSVALSELYLKQIISNDYDVMSAVILRDPPFKVLRLFWKTKLCS